MQVTYLTTDKATYLVWPHVPDWSRNIARDREWFGSVSTGLNGSESRTQVSPRPMLRLKFECAAFDHEEGLGMASNVEALAMTGYCACPLWGRGVKMSMPTSVTTVEVAEDVSATVGVITVEDVRLWNWKIDDYVFLRFDGPENYEIWETAQIASVTDTTLVLTAELGRTYPAGIRVYPLITGEGNTEQVELRTDHHMVVAITIAGMRDDMAFAEEGIPPFDHTPDQTWEMPLQPLTGTATATDETVTAGFPNKDAVITVVVHGGEQAFSVASQDGLGTQTGRTTSWPAVAGKKTYSFIVTAGDGSTITVSVYVYREAWTWEFGSDGNWVVKLTNNSPDISLIDFYLNSTKQGNWWVNTAAGETTYAVVGPGYDALPFHLPWNRVGAAKILGAALADWHDDEPYIQIAFDGSVLTSVVYGQWTETHGRE